MEERFDSDEPHQSIKLSVDANATNPLKRDKRREKKKEKHIERKKKTMTPSLRLINSPVMEMTAEQCLPMSEIKDNTVRAIVDAIMKEHEAELDELLQAADFQSVINSDIHGASLLHIAASKSSSQMIESLVKFGFNVNSETLLPFHLYLDRFNAGAKLRTQTTPSYVATVAGNLSVLHALHERGGNVNMADCDKFYPLHNAAWNNRTDLIKNLINYGAKVNVKDFTGSTPLRKAAYRGNIEAVRFLLAQNADVNSKTMRGRTALHAASLYGHCEIIDILVEGGAKIDAQDIDDLTALHAAAYNGKQAAVKTLLRQKAKVDQESKFGNTPLHLACAEKWFVIAQVLLQAGADLNKQNKFGESCADSLKAGNSGKRLLSYGAKFESIPRADLERLEEEFHSVLPPRTSVPTLASIE